jgi:hypothetical protein
MKKITAALMGSAALAFGATGFAMQGYSAWNTITPIAGGPLTAATLSLTTGSVNQLSQSIANLAPGDTASMVVDLQNSGTEPFSSISFEPVVATTDTSPTPLITQSSGLQISIDSCSVPWDTSTSTPSCSGTVSTSLPQTALSTLIETTSATPLSSVNMTGSSYLEVNLLLPTSAPASDQDYTDAVNYEFTAEPIPSGAIGG